MKNRHNMRKAIYGIGASLSLLPLPVIAQVTDFKSFVAVVTGNILKPLVPLIVTLALVYFLWGASKYILHGGDETKRAEGQKMMIYGVIALFVMVSVWGFVLVLQNTFFGGGLPTGPYFPTPGP